ncbi:MAG: hypothetical protein WCJ38_04775 [Actinomycetes bacterium]
MEFITSIALAAAALIIGLFMVGQGLKVLRKLRKEAKGQGL